MVPQKNPITRNPIWKSHSYLFCVVDQQSIAMMFRELLYGKTLVALVWERIRKLMTSLWILKDILVRKKGVGILNWSWTILIF